MRKWSQKHDRCTKCGTTTVRHFALGMCGTCYGRAREKKTDGWSKAWGACRMCGETERRHKSHGFCTRCAKKGDAISVILREKSDREWVVRRAPWDAPLRRGDLVEVPVWKTGGTLTRVYEDRIGNLSLGTVCEFRTDMGHLIDNVPVRLVRRLPC